MSSAAETKQDLSMQRQQLMEWTPKRVHAASTNEGMGSKTRAGSSSKQRNGSKTRSLHNAAVTTQVSA